jgi:hypothetical protein
MTYARANGFSRQLKGTISFFSLAKIKKMVAIRRPDLSLVAFG